MINETIVPDKHPKWEDGSPIFIGQNFVCTEPGFEEGPDAVNSVVKGLVPDNGDEWLILAEDGEEYFLIRERCELLKEEIE